VRQTGTQPELALRTEIDRLGLEYATDTPVRGTRARADLLFEHARVVVLVDGCYWHGCPTHGTAPKANAEWWRQKLASNRRRDELADRNFHDLGWLVLRFWEHDDPLVAAMKVAAVVKEQVAARQGIPAAAINGD